MGGVGGALGPGNTDEVDACGEGGENEVKCFERWKRVYSWQRYIGTRRWNIRRWQSRIW